MANSQEKAKIPLSADTKVKRHGWFKVVLDWLKDNPIKTILGSAIVLVGVPWLNTYFESVFIHRLVPLNVVTTVTASNPSKEAMGSGDEKFSPLELDVTVKNPGRRKLYLLKTMWVGEVCSIISHYADGSDTGDGTETGEATFHANVMYSNQVFNDNGSQIYSGYSRFCKFIGTGRLLHDSSISPDETLNVRVVIVHPAQMDYLDKASKDVDFIRITTFIPSMSHSDDSIRAQLVFSGQSSSADEPKLMKAPKGIMTWAKKDVGKLPGCVLEVQGGAELPEKFGEQKDVIETNEELGHQVWCPLFPADKQYRTVNVTRSINEVWLSNRKP